MGDLTPTEDIAADQASPHKDRAKTDKLSKAEYFIFAFIKAKNDLLIYPAANPVVNESIEEALRLLKENFASGEMACLFVEKDRIQVNGDSVGSGDPRVSKLTLALYRRGVRKLVIDPGITFEEIKDLLAAINLKVEEIEEAGGITALIQSRGISRAAVEDAAELTIVDGASLPVSDDAIDDIEGLEDIEMAAAQLDSTERFSRMFVRVEEGDLAGIRHLRKLLQNPEVFSGILEKFALHIQKVEGEVDPKARIERMLEVLQIVGSAIASLPSEDERSQMLNNLAVSVLGLSANLRDELVSQGIMPNLALKGVESNILSRFPVTQLADAILEDFQVSGGAASVMESYFRNLDLSETDSSTLADTLHYSLNQSGMMNPEIDAVLTSEGKGVGASAEDAQTDRDGAGAQEGGPPELDVPRLAGYLPEKILFQGDERAELMRQVSKEFESPAADIMAPALLELMRHEKTPLNHAALVERAVSYMEHFLLNQDYERAADLLQGMRAELHDRAEIFSGKQLEPLRDAVDTYIGEQGIRRVADNFRNLNRESPHFQSMVKYFAAIGSSAMKTLLRILEDEESRHVRLLICQALAQTGEKAVAAVAGKVNHPQWFVVRNAVSILGQIGTADCVPHLRKALTHQDSRVRREALKGLVSVKTEEAIDAVCACVSEEDTDMCKAALGWIAAMGTERALPALQNLLGKESIWKSDDDVVRLAIEALETIESESAVALLEELTETRRLLFRRRKAALIRQRAADALRRIEGK